MVLAVPSRNQSPSVGPWVNAIVAHDGDDALDVIAVASTDLLTDVASGQMLKHQGCRAVEVAWSWSGMASQRHREPPFLYV